MAQTKCCSQCGKKLKESNNKLININHENIIETKSENQIELSLENSNESNSIINKYGNVEVTNSKKVIIGNVTYITGPVHLRQVTAFIEEERITNQLYLNGSDIENINLGIISRKSWMAEEPKLITPLPGPVQYVIIAHTATEDGYTEPQNALLTKLIQNFHMDSRGWDDIAYNFLVGCDGNIYKGRGWNVEGSHTYGYNRKSMCIAFIGCFMDHLPPISALKAARKLIFEGVKSGFIPENYTLVGHCQCIPIESPGVQLFNEIKKWPRWRELTPADSKS